MFRFFFGGFTRFIFLGEFVKFGIFCMGKRENKFCCEGKKKKKGGLGKC